jgi:hypothetical protein
MQESIVTTRFGQPQAVCRDKANFFSSLLFLNILFQFREGSLRLVSSQPSNSQHCPVALTRLYFRRLGGNYLDSRSDSYLVPRTKKLTGGFLAADESVALSYTTAMEDFRSLLLVLGYNPCLYTEHSGKRGGATTAAERGMPEADLQRLGGWKSRAMVAKYTDASVQRRLAMSDFLS